MNTTTALISITILLAALALTLGLRKSFAPVWQRIRRQFQPARRQVTDAGANGTGASTNSNTNCRWQPESVRDRERQRLALDLHDEFGQLITALQLQLAALEIQERLTQADVQELSVLAHTMRRSLAALLNDLQPSARFGDLRSGLNWLCNEHALRYGRRCHVHWAPSVPALPETVQNALFRISQEALTNCARHARASCAEVKLSADAGQLTLSVSDDGVGAITPLTGTGRGLPGMRERVEELGGQLYIETAATGGFQVRVELPLPQSTPGSQP